MGQELDTTRTGLGLGIGFVGFTLVGCFVAKHNAQKVLNDIQDVNHPYINESKEKLKNIL